MDNKKQQQDEEVLEKDDLVDNESVDSSNNNDTAQNEETVEGDNVTDINSKLDEKKLKDELDELTDNYQRLQAEYANYRRRTQQEKDSLSLFANEKIMT